MRLARCFFAAVAVVLSAPIWAQPIPAAASQPQLPPNQVDGLAAVVGKEIVLHSEVFQQKEALDREFAQTGQPAPSLCAVFSELVVEKLLLHHAEIDSVVVSDPEVDDAIGRRVEQLSLIHI